MGVNEMGCGVIRGFGPLTVIGAQFIYLSQPLLSRSLPGEQLDGLAQLLEDSSTTHAFIDYLRETDVQ